MAGLSLFVSHGAAVWQALVAAALVVGALVAWRGVDRAMRVRARRVRESLADASALADPQSSGTRVTLVGTLSALGGAADGTAPSEEEQPKARAGPLAVTVVPQGLERVEEATPKARSASARGATLALDLNGARVVLDGPIQILAGSRETEACIGKAAAQALLWDFAGELGSLPPRAFGVRALANGDRVIARGLLRHDPDPDDAVNYRSARARFALEVDDRDPDARVIPLVYDGAPRPLLRPRARTALRALAVPVATLAFLGLAGEVAARGGRAWSDAVAAATPFRRADALRQLRERIGLRNRADAASVGRAVALDELRGRCSDASDDLFEHHRLQESIQTAARCKDPAREARAWFALAELEQAAAAFARARAQGGHLAPSLSEATAYLAANRFDDAAVALHALARTWDDGPAARDALECAALHAEHLAKKPDAAGALHARKDTTNSSAACALLWLDAADEHGDWVLQEKYHYYWSPTSTFEPRLVGNALMRERTSRLEILDDEVVMAQLAPSSIVFDPRAGVYAVPLGLARAVAARLATREGAAPSLVRARSLQQMAWLDAYLGETEAARQELDEAGAALATARAALGDDASMRRRREAWRWRDPNAEERAMVLAHEERAEVDIARYALEVRGGAGDALAPKDVWAWRLADLDAARAAKRGGDGAALARLAQRDARDANRKLWDFALAEDGTSLVGRLEDRGMDGRGVVDFLGAQTEMREELARWVRYGYPAACATCGLYPLANQVASRRDAAAAAGAHDVEAEMGQAARRIRAVLARRDLAVILAVIGSLSPP